MSRLNFVRVVNLSQSSGEEINVNLFLEEKPMREEQKRKTLTKYIEQYPSGWKKRLELADLFYEMGRWYEAIEHYDFVVEKQPQLLAVKLKLGKILQLMGKKEEAIAIYKSCLPFMTDIEFSQAVSSNISNSHRANKFHIMGLIEVCQGNLNKAAQAFSSATVFAPENASHWLALGKVYREMDNNIEALKAFDAILAISPDDIVALINLYDVMMDLAQAKMNLPSNLRFTHRHQDCLDNETIWYSLADEKLEQAIALAPHNYQVLKRQIASRCRHQLVLGKEGKQTKKLINLLSKMAPDSSTIEQLKNNYYFLKAQAQEKLRLINHNNLQHLTQNNIIEISSYRQAEQN